MASLQRQWHLTPVDPQRPFDPEALMRRAPPFHMEEDETLPEHLARVQRDAPRLPMVRVPPQFTELTLSSHHGAGADFSTTLGQFELIITGQRHARAAAARLTQLGNLLDNTDLTDDLSCAVIIGHTTLIAEQISWNADSRELILTGLAPMTWLPEVLERRQWRALSGLMRLSLPVHDRGTHSVLTGAPHAGHGEFGQRLIGLGAPPVDPQRPTATVSAVTPVNTPPSAPPTSPSTPTLTTMNEADDFELWEDPDEVSAPEEVVTRSPAAVNTPVTLPAPQPHSTQPVRHETPAPAFDDTDNPWEGWDPPEPEQAMATPESSETEEDWFARDTAFIPNAGTQATPPVSSSQPDRQPSLTGEPEWTSGTDSTADVTEPTTPDQRFKLNRSEPFLIPTGDDEMDDDLDESLDASESGQAATTGTESIGAESIGAKSAASRADQAEAPSSQSPLAETGSAERPVNQPRTGRMPERPSPQSKGASQRAVVEAAVRAGLKASPSPSTPDEEHYSDPTLRPPSAKTTMTGKRAEALKRASEPRKREQSDKPAAPDAREVARALGFALERIPPRMLKVAIFLAAMMIAMLIFLFVAGR